MTMPKRIQLRRAKGWRQARDYVLRHLDQLCGHDLAPSPGPAAQMCCSSSPTRRSKAAGRNTMTGFGTANASPSAEDLAACRAAAMEIARELGRRLAREDFERLARPQPSPSLAPPSTGVSAHVVQNCRPHQGM
jgi:hypothetical protein